MAKNKCYVVWAGHKTGLFHSWAETQAATSGYPNAKFKGFPSEELAKAALGQGNPSTQTKEQSAKSLATIDSDVQFWIDGSCHPEIGRSGSGIVKINPKLGKVLTVSCGGCDENGTNNTGELIALRESLCSANDILSKGMSVEVFSDSEYAINSVTKWAYKWKKNGWRKSDNKAIENQRLIEECHNLYTQLEQSRIRITHSPAHKGFYYNELADRLAQIAAQFRFREVTEYQAFDEDSIIKWKIGSPMPTLR